MDYFRAQRAKMGLPRMWRDPLIQVFSEWHRNPIPTQPVDNLYPFFGVIGFFPIECEQERGVDR